MVEFLTVTVDKVKVGDAINVGAKSYYIRRVEPIRGGYRLYLFGLPEPMDFCDYEVVHILRV